MADTKIVEPLSSVLTRTLEEALARGESLQGLQWKCGVDRRAIAKYLSGERGLHIQSIDKLAAHFALELRPRARARKDS